jgi:hypothetical protein
LADPVSAKRAGECSASSAEFDRPPQVLKRGVRMNDNEKVSALFNQWVLAG